MQKIISANLGRRFAIAATAWLAFASPTFASTLYVPLGNADAILVLDADRDVAIGRVGEVPEVHGLAATRDGRYLVAGSYRARPLTEAAPPKPEAVTEEEHAAHHAKPVIGARQSIPMVSTLSIIDTEKKESIRRIDVPGAVHHVAVSPDGRLAAVTHPNDGAISVLDLSSYTLVATLSTGPLPNYAVFAPDGQRLYVSNAGNGTISDVDTSRWIVSRNVIVGNSPEHVVLSKDGSRLYVNNVEDGTVSIVATDQGKVVKTIAVGSTLHGIDLSDTDEVLFVAIQGDDKIAAINLGTGTVREIHLAPDPYHLIVVPGKGKMYVSSASEPKVWVVDQATLNVVNEIEIDGKGHQMVLAPGS